jgi:LEA14-like dessication related protein
VNMWVAHEFCTYGDMKLKTYFTPLLFVLLVGWAGCKEIKDPEFRRIERFRVKSLGLQHATVGFSITYHNPNNFKVSVKEAVADVVLDSIPIGQFTQDSTITVNKSSEFSIPLTGTISLATLRKLDPSSLAFREIPVKATGSVKVGKGGIFVSRPVEYQGRHRLEIKL